MFANLAPREKHSCGDPELKSGANDLDRLHIRAASESRGGRISKSYDIDRKRAFESFADRFAIVRKRTPPLTSMKSMEKDLRSLKWINLHLVRKMSDLLSPAPFGNLLTIADV
jgi:hypothetical protein